MFNYTTPTGASGWSESESMKFTTSEFDHKLILAQKITMILIAILTSLGNTLVLLATWRERSLHEPNKYFIACLAVADLLVGILVAPIRAYELTLHIRELLTVPFHLCRFLRWMDTLVLTASIYSLTFISFDRYLKISKPLQYRSRMTTSRSLKIIFIIWFISTAFATYAATPQSGSFGMLNTHGACQADWTKMKRFYTFQSTIAFFLPTGVILVMYTLIFLAAHKRQKMLRNGELGQSCDDRNQRSVFLQDLKVIRMFMVVVGVFIFCWGPHFIFTILVFYKPDFILDFTVNLRGFVLTSTVMDTLPYFNSLCNPVIYACLDQKYSKAFKHLFQRMMCRQRNSRRQPPDAIELRQLRTRQT